MNSIKHEILIRIANYSVVTSPSNEQEGSEIKCLREKVLCLISPYWEISKVRYMLHNIISLNQDNRGFQF